jgi:predicted RNA-binding protein with PIN domain
MAHGGKIALIDGYNVIMRHDRWRGVFNRNQDQARSALLSYCAEWKARRGDIYDFIVVFDGGPAVMDNALPHIPHVRAVFTRGGETADDHIIAILRQKAYGGRHVVVSDDREVAGKSKALGAETVSVSAFCAQLRPRAQSESPEDDKNYLSPQEKKAINDELRQVFGIE